MGWRRKETEPSCYYDRLLDGEGACVDEKIPKGYVPMMVGGEVGEVERVLVNVKILKDPCIATLLELAAQEFGYRQQGILRILCDAQHFRRMVDVISKSR